MSLEHLDTRNAQSGNGRIRNAHTTPDVQSLQSSTKLRQGRQGHVCEILTPSRL